MCHSECTRRNVEQAQVCHAGHSDAVSAALETPSPLLHRCCGLPVCARKITTTYSSCACSAVKVADRSHSGTATAIKILPQHRTGTAYCRAAAHLVWCEEGRRSSDGTSANP